MDKFVIQVLKNADDKKVHVKKILLSPKIVFIHWKKFKAHWYNQIG